MRRLKYLIAGVTITMYFCFAHFEAWRNWCIVDITAALLFIGFGLGVWAEEIGFYIDLFIERLENKHNKK